MDKNIVFFLLDQLSFRALPVYGNQDADTPNLNWLTEDALVVDGCYTTCPLCVPARTALWSGRYPHETGVISNGHKWQQGPLPEEFTTVGECFRDAGWQAVHFGKDEGGGALRGFDAAPMGVTRFEAEDPAFPLNGDSFRDRHTTDAVCQFLEQREDDRPLFLVADLVNPHNICGWVGANEGVHTGVPSERPLPQLPVNFAFDDIENRPAAIQYLCCSHNRQAQTAGWEPENFREYLRAYHYYLSLADRDVGRILEALKKRGFTTENTLFVFTADHGDSMAARGQVTKQIAMYEETTRIPLAFKGAGVQPGVKTGLASSLDLFPTLCSWAGIRAPEGLRGQNLTEVLNGGELPERECIAAEWHTEYGYTVSPGRMIRSGSYKYTKFIEDGKEELFDLKADPYERINLAVKADSAGGSEYTAVLEQMRRTFREHLARTQDSFETLAWDVDKRWRSHPVGYQNHQGIAAPMEK